MSTSNAKRTVSSSSHRTEKTPATNETNTQTINLHNHQTTTDSQPHASDSNPPLHMHDVHSLTTEDIQKRLNAAELKCQSKGVRFTLLRRNIYQLILQSDKPLGAYDLIQRLQSNRVRNEGEGAKMVAPPTVYRTLDFLLNLGFIHQLTSINAFVPCCHPRDQHNAVFLLCDVCQHVQEFSGIPVQSVTNYIKADLGFQVEHSVMELKGRCHQCLPNKPSNRASL